MAPTFTYDLATTTGRARLMIPDRDPTAPIFSDQELAAFAAVEGDSPHLVAALALETRAADYAVTFGANRVADIQTNGPAVAAALMKRAEALRAQALEADAAAGALFDVAEQVFDVFTARARLLDQAERGVV